MDYKSKNIKSILISVFYFLIIINTSFAYQLTVYDEIQEKISTIKSIRSNFSQIKKLEALANPIVSEGVFYYKKPNKIYWCVEAPKMFGFSVGNKKEKAKRWGAKKNRFQYFDITKETGLNIFYEQLLVWIQGNFKELKKRYKITQNKNNKKFIEFELTPKIEEEKSYISYFKVFFNLNKKQVERIEIYETAPNYTIFEFKNTQINPDIPDSFFE